ncbi:MAG: hypothetical protein JWO79_4354 [Actinomycetia bacterium]|nr:hypothetical protein [Actinomycetes bacterium]
MDGNHRSRTTTARGRARHAIVAALCFLAWGTAPALADPATDYAGGTELTQRAQDIARSVWAADPCAGEVTISWMALSPTVNATSTWSNPVGQYDAPAQNTVCAIAFNTAVSWDWVRFCSILVHEYGHLTGHPHDDDPASIMSAFYTRPVDQCAAAAPVAAPAATVAAAAPATAAAVSAATVRQSTASSMTAAPAAKAAHHVRRGVLVRVRHRHRHRGRHGHRRHRHLGTHRRHRSGQVRRHVS